MRSRLGTDDPDADLNADGRVNPADVMILRDSLGAPPGPSGIPNFCSLWKPSAVPAQAYALASRVMSVS